MLASQFRKACTSGRKVTLCSSELYIFRNQSVPKYYLITISEVAECSANIYTVGRPLSRDGSFCFLFQAPITNRAAHAQ